MKLSEELKREALEGILLAIDPASGGTSQPGWAVFKQGGLKASGELALEGNIVERLSDLLVQLNELMIEYEVTALVVEQLPRRVHHYVMWSVGVTIAAAPEVLPFAEIPISAWKEIAREQSDYVKGDAADARCIGQAVVSAARGRDLPTSGRGKRGRGRPKTAVRARNSVRKRPRRVGTKSKRGGRAASRTRGER